LPSSERASKLAVTREKLDYGGVETGCILDVDRVTGVEMENRDARDGLLREGGLLAEAIFAVPGDKQRGYRCPADSVADGRVRDGMAGRCGDSLRVVELIIGD